MSFEPSVVILSLVIVLFATFVRSTFGFADALVSMPLLTMTIGIETARPLVAMVSTVFAAVVLLMDWRQVSFGSAWRLTLCAIIGVPIGFLLADRVQEEHVQITLAIVIIVFSAYSLFRPRIFRLTTDRSSYAFGLTAGIFGGVVNIPGPPIAIYGTLRGWSPPQFRATFQSYGLPTSLAIVIGHAAKGRFNPDVGWLLLAPVGTALHAKKIWSELARSAAARV